MLITHRIFICSLVPVGLAHNFATFVVVRFLGGCCVQVLSNAVASIISNVYEDGRARGAHIALYVTTYLATTSLGPVIQPFEQVYRELYHWSAVQAGCVQAAIVIGKILGCGLCFVSNNWYYASASRNKEVSGAAIPEARLYASVIGGILGITGGMLVYGWTSYLQIHWMALTMGLVLVGFGTTAVVVNNANYLVDAYRKYAASALAAAGLIENLSIAFLPLASPALYTNLGFHWASSLLAFILLLLAITPVIVMMYGPAVRRRSSYMKEAVSDLCLGKYQSLLKL